MDSIVDSTNIGAIFRSAAALGIDAILVTTTCCDPLNRRAIRVSMGSVFLIPWTWTDAATEGSADDDDGRITVRISLPKDDAVALRPGMEAVVKFALNK